MIALKSNPDKAPKTDYYKNDKSSKQRLLSSGNVNVNFVNLMKKVSQEPDYKVEKS